jgi:hypothetical protein
MLNLVVAEGMLDALLSTNMCTHGSLFYCVPRHMVTYSTAQTLESHAEHNDSDLTVGPAVRIGTTFPRCPSCARGGFPTPPTPVEERQPEPSTAAAATRTPSNDASVASAPAPKCRAPTQLPAVPPHHMDKKLAATSYTICHTICHRHFRSALWQPTTSYN